MHSVILGWFSLDVVWSWMITKDGLYLIDSHQIVLKKTIQLMGSTRPIPDPCGLG